MRIDVTTLYLLIAGTTFIGASLTAWQRRFCPAYRRELAFWALGQFLVGLGCLVRIQDGRLPEFVSIGLSNLAVLAGYAAIAAGTILFADKRVSPRFLVMAACMALGWLAWGQFQPVETRIVVTALGAGALNLQAAFALRGRDDAGPLASQRLVRTMLALHGLFFLGRAGVTLFGIEDVILFTGLNFAITMAEGVLWSAFLPVGLLTMVREKTERELVAASETDFLTGVDNRRAFIGKAERLIEAETVAAVVVFDLDHFKIVNDRHGHALGDEVLRIFCRVAEGEMSVGDLFGRLGGEEFAAVFQGCDALEAQQLATEIAKRYTAEVALRFALSLRATASAGIVAVRQGAELAELLCEADGALYQAKKNGRDQAVIADARPSPSLPVVTRAA